jgi:hypothetical protein
MEIVSTSKGTTSQSSPTNCWDKIESNLATLIPTVSRE